MIATVRSISDAGLPGQLAELAGLEREGRAAGARQPTVVADLYQGFKERGLKLVDVAWEQQTVHEAHRWNVVEALSSVDVSKLTQSEKWIVWNAGRAELTAKPSADRLSRQADSECRRLRGTNDAAAAVLQAFGTWTRYWNEEEGRHETGLNRLAALLDLPPLDDATFLEYRRIFPDDNMLRTMTLMTFSECLAAVNYAQASRHVSEPGLKALFKRIAADEVHHMHYFLSFAKGMVDSGEYAAKECFAVAHLFMREGGELQGVKREHLEQREHVNWWDHVEYNAAIDVPEALERKQTLMLYALRRMTGIACSSAAEVEERYLELVGC